MYHYISRYFKTSFLSFHCLFKQKEMDLEQIVKDLQAQNAQFQQMFLALAKGQEDLKALILKDKKKKTKKPVGVLNMGRRLRGPAKRALEFATPSNEGDNQEEKTQEEDHSPGSVEEEADYAEEQYPPVDDKYKQLEDHLNTMEIQRVHGMDFEELSLISRVFIPPKFKVPTFSKYDRVSCPKLHLISYIRKIQPHTVARKLWVHFF